MLEDDLHLGENEIHSLHVLSLEFNPSNLFCDLDGIENECAPLRPTCTCEDNRTYEPVSPGLLWLCESTQYKPHSVKHKLQRLESLFSPACTKLSTGDLEGASGTWRAVHVVPHANPAFTTQSAFVTLPPDWPLRSPRLPPSWLPPFSLLLPISLLPPSSSSSLSSQSNLGVSPFLCETDIDLLRVIPLLYL